MACRHRVDAAVLCACRCARDRLAAQLAPVGLALCHSVSPHFRLIVDAAQLKPQEDEGQRALRSFLESLSQRGLVNAAIVVTNTITRMQLKRFTRELVAKSLGFHWHTVR